MTFSLCVLAHVALAGQPLPGDDVIGQAAGTQDEPDLIAGDGDVWLLVWRDTRATLAGTLGSDVTDVYAMRIDAHGAPLDEVSFPIASGPWTESDPRGAWNGTDWLVAYDADAATPTYWSQGVYARRVDPTGGVLDAVAILLEDEEFVDETLWDVSSDGDSWAILWQGVDLAAGLNVMDGTTVTAAGAAAPPMTVYTPSDVFGAPWNARIAWADDRYMSVWGAWDNDDDVEAIFFDSSLAPIGSMFEVAGDANSSVMPGLGSNGTGFYVAWFDNTFGAVWGEVRGTPVSVAGVVAAPNGTNLSGQAYPIDAHPSVASMGGGWGVAWEYGAAAAIAVSLTDGSGNPGKSLNATGELGYTVSPTVADGGDKRILAAWATYGDRSDFDIETVGANSKRKVGVIQDVSLATPAQTHPAIAGDASGALVVGRSETADEEAILAWRVDELGVVLDAEPIEIARGIGVSEPSVAWNGNVWLVVWTDVDTATEVNGIVGVRVDVDGILLDAVPLEFIVGTSPTVAASSGGDFLVAGIVPITFDTNELWGLRVSDAGVILDTSFLALGTNYVEGPDATAFGTGWIVTWAHRHSHDSGLRDAMYTLVSSTGNVGGGGGVRTQGSVAKESGVNVASDGTEALVVWSDNGDIRGRFVDSSGDLTGAGAGFVISDASNSQFDPDVAWNGLTYTVAWTDYRVHAALEPGEGDLYATNVDAAGVVDSPLGIAIDADDVPEGNAALAGADGVTVLVWTKLVNEAPYGSFRLQMATHADEGVVGFGAGDFWGCMDGGFPGGALALLFPVLLIRRRR